MNKLQKSVELSIIILTYNNQEDLPNCLESIYKFHKSHFVSKNWELIVIDNNSTDSTIKDLTSHLRDYPNLQIRENKENLGFATANNVAAATALGDYILFLNADTVLEPQSITLVLKYLEDHSDVGAATAKVLLGDGTLDYSCHRGFPTPWNALCFFSGLAMLFPGVPLFSGYTLSHLDLNSLHQVDAITGAFFLLPAKLGRRLGYFDTSFFWNGEDLDLCYRIKALGYKIMYLPQVVVHHHKGASGGHKRGSATFAARFKVMELFYDKHYQNKYPRWLRTLVLTGVKARQALAYLGK